MKNLSELEFDTVKSLLAQALELGDTIDNSDTKVIAEFKEEIELRLISKKIDMLEL